MDKSGIYTITNLLDNKIYVGYATNFRKRKGDHISNLRKNKHKNIHLQRAFNRDGENNFKVELLEEYPINILPSMENYWCNLLNAHNPNFGYNILPTSDFGLITHSKESREKISKALKGRKLSKEHKEKCKTINIGRKHTEEAKVKMKMALHENVKKGSIKLNEEQVKEIIYLINTGEKSSIIAKKFNVSRWTIANIKYNKQWKFLDKEYIKSNKSRYSIEQINRVREELNNNKAVKEISLELNIPTGIIYKIKYRHNYGM